MDTLTYAANDPTIQQVTVIVQAVMIIIGYFVAWMNARKEK